MAADEVRVVMLPDPLIASAVAAGREWRALGYRWLEFSKAACPRSRDRSGGKDHGKVTGGSLAATLEVRFRGGIDPRIECGSKATVGKNLSLLGLILEGTDAHTIVPVNARALRFTVEGKVVFARRVQHPGTKKNPFIQHAAVVAVAEAGGAAAIA